MFQQYAWVNHKAGTSRVNIIRDTETDNVAGFLSLSSAQIERIDLAKSDQRNPPDPVPVTLLGQLAVDNNYQGQGCAQPLLLFALKTALNASQLKILVSQWNQELVLCVVMDSRIQDIINVTK